MDDTSFGCVIRRLQLGDVDNVSAHTRSSNEAAVGETLKFFAVQVRTLLLLTPPVGTSSPRTVESAIEIGCHNLTVVSDLSVEHGALLPWNPGIGDENIETAIEFFDNLGD